MLHFILKGAPLIVGLLLTTFLPYLLYEKTHQYARDSVLIKRRKEEDRNPHDSLDYVLNWRDLITTIFTGIFVLQFAAAEEITSTSQKLAFINLPFNWHLSDVATILTIFVPVVLIFAFFLSVQVKTTGLQSKRQYWTKFCLFVLPSYFLAFLFVYSA